MSKCDLRISFCSLREDLRKLNRYVQPVEQLRSIIRELPRWNTVGVRHLIITNGIETLE